LVFAALTENSTTCRLQESLLTVLCICDLFGMLSGLACHCGTLARITLVLLYHDAFASKVELDIIQILVLVQTDLNSTVSSADSFHIILFEGN